MESAEALQAYLKEVSDFIDKKAAEAADTIIKNYDEDEILTKRDLWRAAKAGFGLGAVDIVTKKTTEALAERFSEMLVDGGF